MGWELLKMYLAKKLQWLPIPILIFLSLYYLVKDKSYLQIYAIFWAIDLIAGFFPFAKRQLYLSDLQQKGLTEKDINNAAFLDRWKENRERGLLKYCIIDGGLILGAILSIFIGLTGMIFLANKNDHIFSDPSEMLSYIGYCYLAGATLGIIINRYFWYINQKKFTILIDQQD
ncbi:MAG TPA: hypothetical protein VK671_06970 [Mucilaginibacter sp.]|jgi:hypothetical protein|nr:hypothetical protein [Mucilaginibacter sp.]